jgi:oligopeptide transport system substrate-binding protein
LPRPAPLLAVLAVLVLAGCTSGGSGPSRPSDRSQGGGAAPASRVGGTLAIALLDPGRLDPARADGLQDEIVLGNLFDGLTALDPAGAVRPAIAASWASDPTLRRWEFRLRPEARWSDGSPVTASDFTFAWQRLADPTARPRPSPARSLLEPVTGFRAFTAGRARSISGLQAPDPTTLRVALDHPLADFPAVVASLRLSPLPSELAAADPAAYLANPVGNGPFRPATRIRPGRPIVLERNPSYWGRPALLDRVDVHTVPDEQTAWLELQHGRVVFAPVPPDQVPAARTVHGLSADGRTRPGLLAGPTLTSWQLTFDLKSKPASDPRWRQAFSLAIDRDRLAASLAASPAVALVPPGTPGTGSAATPPCQACTHDLARARSQFAQLAAGTGRPQVTLGLPPDPTARRIATRIAGDLAAAGLKLTLDPTATPKGPVALVRRVAPYPRPGATLTTPTGYKNPTVDRLLDQAGATPDDSARARLYDQAEEAILADLPVAPLLTEHHAAVLAPGVEGFDLPPWATVDLTAVSLPA